ncbi:MAG: hypothetical protein ACERKO_08045 [Acetanaerobacterium sp.]
MNKRVSRTVGLILLAVAVIFVIFALNHPEMSFTIPINLTYVLYIIYVIVMAVFLIAPFKKKR